MDNDERPQASPSGDGSDRFRQRRKPIRWLLPLFVCALLATVVVPLPAQTDPFSLRRHSMVESQIRGRGITQHQVLSAMEEVPRHLFVPEPSRPQAYEDVPVTIAPGQTLYQAYLSALLISNLGLTGKEKVLEVGTGSGYDAAILSRLAGQVFTIEINPQVGQRARKTLRDLGYRNVEVRIGDGYRGWPEEAPFDAILLTAAPEHIPEPLFEQLKIGGKMVVAVGRMIQDLKVITKTSATERDTRKIRPVVMVPMTGEVDQQP